MAIPTYDWIAHYASTRGDCVAMEDLASGRIFTYAEFNHRVGRLADGLRTRFGVVRGDRVAVLAQTRPTCSSSSSPARASARCSRR